MFLLGAVLRELIQLAFIFSGNVGALSGLKVTLLEVYLWQVSHLYTDALTITFSETVPNPSIKASLFCQAIGKSQSSVSLLWHFVALELFSYSFLSMFEVDFMLFFNVWGVLLDNLELFWKLGTLILSLSFRAGCQNECWCQLWTKYSFQLHRTRKRGSAILGSLWEWNHPCLLSNSLI